MGEFSIAGVGDCFTRHMWWQMTVCTPGKPPLQPLVQQLGTRSCPGEGRCLGSDHGLEFRGGGVRPPPLKASHTSLLLPCHARELIRVPSGKLLESPGLMKSITVPGTGQPSKRPFSGGDTTLICLWVPVPLPPLVQIWAVHAQTGLSQLRWLCSLTIVSDLYLSSSPPPPPHHCPHHVCPYHIFHLFFVIFYQHIK